MLLGLYRLGTLPRSHSHNQLQRCSVLCVLQVAVVEAMAAAVMDTKLEAFERTSYLICPKLHAV